MAIVLEYEAELACEVRVKKVALLFGILVACAVGNFLLNRAVPMPEWFSLFAHFSAGGLLTAWFIIAVWQWRDASDLHSASFLKFFGTIMAWTALIGVLWELFEFFMFQRGLPSQQWLYDDTIWDLVMDLLGGAVAACWYRIIDKSFVS